MEGTLIKEHGGSTGLQNNLQQPYTQTDKKETTAAHLASHTSDFRICYQNLRSICNKFDSLFLSDLRDYNAFVFSETWLKPSVYSSEFVNTDLFKVFRCDRPLPSGGGGVLIAINSSFKSTQLDLTRITDRVPFYAIVAVTLRIAKQVVNIVAIYIPPTLPPNTVVLFFDLLTETVSLWNDKLIVMEDFNNPNYYPYLLDPDKHAPDGNLRSTLNFVNFYDLTQFNYSLNANNRLLDLVFSDIDCTVSPDIDNLFRIDPPPPPLFLLHFVISHILLYTHICLCTVVIIIILEPTLNLSQVYLW